MIPRMSLIPTFTVKPDVDGTDITQYMDEPDLFFRRIVQYVMNRIEGIETESILCYIIQDTNNKLHRSTFVLEKEGWSKSLEKALEYFREIEEYETCELIKQLKETI